MGRHRPSDLTMTDTGPSVEVGADGRAALIGGYSPTSGHYHFPLAPLCPYSGADDVERVALSNTGALWLWTAVTTAPPGYEGPVPYGFGVIELEREALRVVGRLTVSDPTALRLGQRMHVVTTELPEVGTIWAFAP
jgi:uncharacterized OB-fold protein